jgi:hypothetical protein
MCQFLDQLFPVLTFQQRHILVKGCGKAAAAHDDSKRESASPKSERTDSKIGILHE